MKVLITGSAGFIGFHLTKKLLERGDIVCGLDNLNSYYDIKLKEDRLNEIYKISKENNANFKFYKINLKTTKA